MSQWAHDYEFAVVFLKCFVFPGYHENPHLPGIPDLLNVQLFLGYHEYLEFRGTADFLQCPFFLEL